MLPYRHVTTSGAGILALSFGLPIIAPRMGCFQDLVGDNERGILYDPGSEQSLTEAMKRIREMDMEALQRACGAYSARLSWQGIAQEHACVYAQIMGIEADETVHSDACL